MRWSKAGGVTITGVTDTDGNTYAAANAVETDFSDDTTRMQIWYAQNIGGHATNVITAALSGSVTFTWISVLHFTGAVTASALDDEVGSQVSTSPHVTGAFTTTVPYSAGVYFVSHGEVITDYTVGSGYTAADVTLGGGGFDYGASMYRLYTTVQTAQTAQMTSSATQPGAVVFAAFKGVAGAVTSGRLVGPSVLVR